MSSFIKKIKRKSSNKKSNRPKTLYERKALVLLSAFLYIVLGLINEVPFYVFQILFIIEGLAFFQDSFHSSVKKSNIAIGVLCVFWSFVIAFQTELITGYAFPISNQVVACNLIYVAILGLLIYQTKKKKNMYSKKILMQLSIVLYIVSIVVILVLLSLTYMLQLAEALDLQMTAMLSQILKWCKKARELVLAFPVAEWLLQGSVLCSILLQSNKKYMKKLTQQKKQKEEKKNEEN